MPDQDPEGQVRPLADEFARRIAACDVADRAGRIRAHRRTWRSSVMVVLTPLVDEPPALDWAAENLVPRYHPL